MARSAARQSNALTQQAQPKQREFLGVVAQFRSHLLMRAWKASRGQFARSAGPVSRLVGACVRPEKGPHRRAVGRRLCTHRRARSAGRQGAAQLVHRRIDQLYEDPGRGRRGLTDALVQARLRTAPRHRPSGSQRSRPGATSCETFSWTSRPTACRRRRASAPSRPSGLQRRAQHAPLAAGDALDHRAQLHVGRRQGQRVGQAVAQRSLPVSLRQLVPGRDDRAELLRPGADLLDAGRALRAAGRSAMSISPPATARSSASPLPVRTLKLMPGYCRSIACHDAAASAPRRCECGAPRLTWPRRSVRSASDLRQRLLEIALRTAHRGKDDLAGGRELHAARQPVEQRRARPALRS